MKPGARTWLCALSCALCVSGCFRNTVHSGLPPGKPSPRVDERWRHSLFWGLVDVSGSYDLVQACPKGWAEVHSEVAIPNGALSLITAGLYYSETVSVICAKPDDSLPQIARPRE